MKTRVSTIIVILGVLFVAADNGLGCGPCSNLPPVAVLSADPCETHCGDTVILDGSQSTDDWDPPGIVYYEWDFDYDGVNFNSDYDEGSNDDGIATYVYDVPGIYTVALRVTDDSFCGYSNTDLATCTVTIQGVHNVTKNQWYTTIQAGINDANNNNVIEVHPKTYQENINFNDKTITLRSTEPNDWDVVAGTIIEGDGSGGTVTFDSNDANSVIRGFAIRCGEYGVSCAVSATIKQCIITDNNSYGVYCTSGSANISNNKIYGNGVAGIYLSSTTEPTIKNNEIYDNGKGIELDSGNSAAMIRNNTIVDNTDYGIKKASGAEPNISNCIIWDCNDDLAGCSATYSCIQDGNTGTGNISNDPCFVDSDANDFHLKSGSPCINAGDPNGNYAGEVDIDGFGRVIGGEGDVRIVDMGADEWESQIPELDWPEERSDWINVKTDVTPAAIGDGVADDTKALQEALDQITPDTGIKKTVYLPPGTYRITHTLQLTTQEYLIQGGLVLGHGRATRIVWDGNEGGTMLWTTKAGYIRYIGQIWDGKGKAAIGIYHHSDVQQRLVRHRNQAFLNFTDAGIRTDTGPTDGVFFENCLFENCTNGVSIGALGYAGCYLNWFDGCEFRNCGRGIYCYAGNIGVRNCHFEGSTNTDIFASVDVHGKQIRRCSSIDSRKFLTDDMDWDGRWGNPQIVEDCHISGWTEPNGAIILGTRGPTTIFDCNFTNPPNYNKPPIRLVNPDSMKQLLVISDCCSPGTAELYYADPNGSHVTEVPAGDYSPFISLGTRSFLKSEWHIPGKVFDAKEDFNAVGNEIVDDTNAIQETINAARNEANDAIAYIPEGIYKVTRTIDVNGADYFIGGAGVRGTVINYFGSEGGVVFNVNDPCNIVMEFIHILMNDICDMTTIPVRQTGSSGNSFILYDGVYGPRHTGQLGWEFENLPYGAKVHLLEVGGSLDIKNSSRATILVNAFDASKCHVVVEGNEPNRDGFLGITAGYSDEEPYQLHVKDNQSIVWANWYQESAYRHIKLEGDANLPAGHVSVAGMKTFSWEQDFITIDNYKGNFFHSGSAIGWNPPGGYAYNQPVEVNQTGTNPVNMMFVGEMFYYKDPIFVYDANAATLILVENIVLDSNDAKHCVGNVGDPNKVRDAFDDFRKLGEVDLLFNHPD